MNRIVDRGPQQDQQMVSSNKEPISQEKFKGQLEKASGEIPKQQRREIKSVNTTSRQGTAAGFFNQFYPQLQNDIKIQPQYVTQIGELSRQARSRPLNSNVDSAPIFTPIESNLNSFTLADVDTAERDRRSGSLPMSAVISNHNALRRTLEEGRSLYEATIERFNLFVDDAVNRVNSSHYYFNDFLPAVIRDEAVPEYNSRRGALREGFDQFLHAAMGRKNAAADYLNIAFDGFRAASNLLADNGLNRFNTSRISGLIERSNANLDRAKGELNSLDVIMDLQLPAFKQKVDEFSAWVIGLSGLNR